MGLLDKVRTKSVEETDLTKEEAEFILLKLRSATYVGEEFETFYKRYNYERPYLVVGIGDGLGNVTWPDLDPMTDISAMDNVFDVFPNWEDGAFSDNPQKIRININKDWN
mgnify:CR=1 FL=1